MNDQVDLLAHGKMRAAEPVVSNDSSIDGDGFAAQSIQIMKLATID
jgi:hypothetical protein